MQIYSYFYKQVDRLASKAYSSLRQAAVSRDELVKKLAETHGDLNERTTAIFGGRDARKKALASLGLTHAGSRNTVEFHLGPGAWVGLTTNPVGGKHVMTARADLGLAEIILRSATNESLHLDRNWSHCVQRTWGDESIGVTLFYRLNKNYRWGFSHTEELGSLVKERLPLLYSEACSGKVDKEKSRRLFSELQRRRIGRCRNEVSLITEGEALRGEEKIKKLVTLVSHNARHGPTAVQDAAGLTDSELI